MGRVATTHTAKAILEVALLAFVFLGTPTAAAQTPEELATGRQLFSEALADEERRRFADALEKYRKVQAIRDTIPVRYRVASALEGLGKLRQAIDAYRATVELGPGTGTDKDVVTAAHARIEALDARVAHLAIRVLDGTAAEVRVDDVVVANGALADVVVDPGAHVVTATSTSSRAQPFRSDVSVAEGGRASVGVTFEPAAPSAAASVPRSGSSSLGTVGIVGAAVGGALVISGVVVLSLRSSTIAELKSACPNGTCPTDREDELRDKQDRARLEGPLGAALLIAGAATVAAGVTFVLIGSSTNATSSARLAFAPGSSGGMLSVRGAF